MRNYTRKMSLIMAQIPTQHINRMVMTVVRSGMTARQTSQINRISNNFDMVPPWPIKKSK